MPSPEDALLNRFDPGWPSVLDIGRGWFDLVIALDKAIATLDPDYTLHQVKEKFGALRYYTGAVDPSVADAVQALISIAENASASLCEECGRPASPTTVNHWIHTYCPEHQSVPRSQEAEE